jgi:SP family general alpha glucoside:H+ symporter-like MFS transporter
MSSIKEKDEHVAHVDVQHSEVLVNQDLMNDALDGENREHQMGVWDAVKKHPWACFWAFTMCFTIVSLLSTLRNDHS